MIATTQTFSLQTFSVGNGVWMGRKGEQDLSESDAEILTTEKTSHFLTFNLINKANGLLVTLYPTQILEMQTVWEEEIECSTLVCALIC